MNRLPALTGLLVAGSLLVAGCGGDGPGGPDADADYAVDGTFTMAINGDLGAFDPYRSLLYVYAPLAYDSLVNLQSDGTYVSGLAEDWDVTAESASFTLTEGVTCSDGSDLTATDVANAINFVSDPENGSSQYGVYTPTVPLSAVGDDASRTVDVTVDEPFGFLLDTIGQLPIVCAAGLEDPDSLQTASEGTGPFVLVDVVPGQSYTFERRDGYSWGPNGAGTDEEGTPKRVVLSVVANEGTSSNLLLSGEINWASVSGADRERLDSAQGVTRIDAPGEGYWLWFNEREGHLTGDEAVRRALVQGIDLEEIIRVSSGGTGTRARSLITGEWSPCAEDTVDGALPEQDIEGAKALLDEAGWVVGDDGIRERDGDRLSLDVHYISTANEYFEPTATLLAAQWEELGVEVEFSPDSNTKIVEVLYETGDWDVYTAGGGFAFPAQAVTSVSGPVPPEGLNFGGIDNAEYNRLVAEAQDMVPPEACEKWNDAERALWAAVSPAPIADIPTSFFVGGGELEMVGLIVVPTSIRVYEK